MEQMELSLPLPMNYAGMVVNGMAKDLSNKIDEALKEQVRNAGFDADDLNVLKKFTIVHEDDHRTLYYDYKGPDQKLITAWNHVYKIEMDGCRIIAIFNP